MSEFKCDVCDQPATIHETMVEEGTAVTRHVCGEHGASALPAINLGPDTARAAEEHFRGLSEAEKEHYAMFSGRRRRQM